MEIFREINADRVRRSLRESVTKVKDNLKRSEIKALMNDLPHPIRELLRLYAWKGMNHQDIAISLGITEELSIKILKFARILIRVNAMDNEFVKTPNPKINIFSWEKKLKKRHRARRSASRFNRIALEFKEIMAPERLLDKQRSWNRLVGGRKKPQRDYFDEYAE